MSSQNTPSPKTNPNSENANSTLEGEPIEPAKTVSTGNQDKEIQFFGNESHKSSGIEVGGGFSCSDLSMRRLLLMAAVSPTGSSDPVDIALKESLRYRFKHGIPNSEIPAENFDPAQNRRYSLARINDMKRTKTGESMNIVIARGDLESVMNVAKPERALRTLLRKNAQMAGSRGYRCLGVATARVDENGECGPFQMEGFINVRPVGTGLQDDDLTPTTEDWVRLSVWSVGLRFLHWLNVFLIVVMSVTGYYIMDPFFGDTFFRGVDIGYLMGIMRFIHFVAAFTWIAIGAVRVVIAFVSKDRYLRWETFWPFKKKRGLEVPERNCRVLPVLAERGVAICGSQPAAATYLYFGLCYRGFPNGDRDGSLRPPLQEHQPFLGDYGSTKRLVWDTIHASSSRHDYVPILGFCNCSYLFGFPG